MKAGWLRLFLFWFGGAPLVELSVDGFVLMFFVDIYIYIYVRTVPQTLVK